MLRARGCAQSCTIIECCVTLIFLESPYYLPNYQSLDPSCRKIRLLCNSYLCAKIRLDVTARLAVACQVTYLCIACHYVAWAAEGTNSYDYYHVPVCILCVVSRSLGVRPKVLDIQRSIFLIPKLQRARTLRKIFSVEHLVSSILRNS